MSDLSDASHDADSDLDALDVSSYPIDAEPLGNLDDITFEPQDRADETIETLMFTATNPDGTVSVTALMNGQILRVSLSPTVASMPESWLSEEIFVLASMSRLQALAGQHAIIATLMGRLGRDPAATRSLLERDLGLPSPESINEARTKVFGARYYRERE